MSVGFDNQGAHGGPSFTASVRWAPDRSVVYLAGELDLGSDAELRALFDKIAGHGAAVTIVDLSEVTFIDAHGIGLIVAAHRSAVERGRVLGVVGLRGPVEYVFSLFPLADLVLTATEAREYEGELGGQG